MKDLSKEQRLEQLGLQPITIRHLRAIAIETYKKLDNKSAIESHILEKVNHGASTRSAGRNDLKTVAAKKDNFKYSFAGVAPKIYNLLSTTTRNAQNVSVFKVNFDKDITKYEQVIKNIFGC